MAFAIGNTLAKDRITPKPFRDALMVVLKEGGEDLPRLRAVASSLIKQAEKGNVPAIKELVDRLDGKVPQALVADEGGPIVLQVVRYVVQEGAQVIDITPDTPTGTDLTVTGQAVLDVNAPPSKPIETIG